MNNEIIHKDLSRLIYHDCNQILGFSITQSRFYNFELNNLKNYLQNFFKQKKLDILDVGCAQGNYSHIFSSLGHVVVGIDIDPYAISYSKLKFPNISFEKIEVEKFINDQKNLNKFDVIYIGEVLEHISNPYEMIKNLRNLLKEGGSLLITTPNYYYIKNKLPSFSNADHKNNLTNFADGDNHYFFYKNEELEDILLKNHFTINNHFFYRSFFSLGSFKIRYFHKFIKISLYRKIEEFIQRSFKKKYFSQIFIHAIKK